MTLGIADALFLNLEALTKYMEAGRKKPVGTLTGKARRWGSAGFPLSIITFADKATKISAMLRKVMLCN